MRRTTTSPGPLRSAATFACAAAVLAWAPVHAAPQLNDGVPRGTEGTGVTQKLGAQAPLDLAFTDQDGNAVTLGDSFREGRPVILTLNYSDCPQLCILQLDGLVRSLNEVGLELGEEIQLVTVSLDPTEAPSRAKLTQEHYLSAYTGEGGADGWTFLVADSEERIRAVADAVGYGYDLDLRTGEYSHEAALMLMTPEGLVSRYLFGIEYDPTTLRMSLVSASEGALGTLTDRIRMFCYRYDPDAGAYTMVAVNVMKLGGLLTVLVLGGFLLFFWRQEILAVLKGQPHEPTREASLPRADTLTDPTR